jgi:hypothetical protein
MSEDNVTKLTPAEEDPIIDRWLASLPELTPSTDFENAVMARVWVPAPRWVQSVRRIAGTLFDRKHAWKWAGGLVASSAVSLAVIVTLTVNYRVQLGTAWASFVDGVAIDVWRTAIAWLGQALATTVALGELLGVNSTVILYASIAGLVVTVFSAWGLHRVFTSFNSERIALHASR